MTLAVWLSLCLGMAESTTPRLFVSLASVAFPPLQWILLPAFRTQQRQSICASVSGLSYDAVPRCRPVSCWCVWPLKPGTDTVVKYRESLALLVRREDLNGDGFWSQGFAEVSQVRII